MWTSDGDIHTFHFKVVNICARFSHFSMKLCLFIFVKSSCKCDFHRRFSLVQQLSETYRYFDISLIKPAWEQSCLNTLYFTLMSLMFSTHAVCTKSVFKRGLEPICIRIVTSVQLIRSGVYSHSLL